MKKIQEEEEEDRKRKNKDEEKMKQDNKKIVYAWSHPNDLRVELDLKDGDS